MGQLELLLKNKDHDESWEQQFLSVFPLAQVRLLSDQPQTGPDGWPYMLVATSDEGKIQATDLLQWMAARGIGLAVNPDKNAVDYIFTYGMIWYFKETGRFMAPGGAGVPTGHVTIEFQTTLHSGAPSEKYLPPYVRKNLRQFFVDQGVFNPRILVISQNQRHYDLVISLDSLDNPPASEHAGIAEAVQWFLPLHYSLVFLKEEGLPRFVGL